MNQDKGEKGEWFVSGFQCPKCKRLFAEIEDAQNHCEVRFVWQCLQCKAEGARKAELLKNCKCDSN